MRRRPTTALVLILALALVVRVAVIAATPDFEPIFDARDFHRHAVSLADGDGYPPTQLGDGPSAFRPPLYPLALAAVQVVGGGYTAERLLNALLGVLTVLLVFVIARRLWSRRVAVVAGTIAAVFPPLVSLSASLLSEALFLPLVLAALLAALQFREDPRLRWALLGGVACGLAALTRGNGLLLILAVGVGVWTMRPRLSRAALAAPLVAVLAMLVVLAPWAVRNTLAFDRWVGLSTQNGFALAGTYNPESRREARHPGEPQSPDALASFDELFARPNLDEAERVELLSDEATDYILEHPGYVLETMAWNVLRLLDIERPGISFENEFSLAHVQGKGVGKLASPLVLASIYVVALLAVLGVIAQAGRRPWSRAPAFVWAVPVLMVLPPLAVYGLARYRAPADPFLVMLVAVGLVAAFERARNPGPGKPAGVAAAG